jgi:hypothetical protein
MTAEPLGQRTQAGYLPRTVRHVWRNARVKSVVMTDVEVPAVPARVEASARPELALFRVGVGM